ncbi:Coiled-coil domain-containing protein [Echinococcus granulosus]|uniref:Coiled-coil domain-containing protein n=2 Tax=Echinococcus granulosus TaxID=6210 RepID=W6US84_ECHGR|nr:Coiled-coil domain-containing protein [Echinococcus granulosus]EUB56299.1 Coiled-coil domain-containing protein [Echinococcus granulosus]
MVFKDGRVMRLVEWAGKKCTSFLLLLLERMEESHLKSIGLSIDALEKDLKRSVREEQRHWHENDAKLRAVQQKVATYEEFRSMVEGCELRPLQLKEVKEATKRYAGWSPLLAPVPSSVKIPQPGDLASLGDFQIVRFNKIDDFIRCWGDLEGHQSERALADLLMEQSRELLQEVFASSAGLPILPRVLKCLLTASSEDPQRNFLSGRMETYSREGIGGLNETVQVPCQVAPRRLEIRRCRTVRDTEDAILQGGLDCHAVDDVEVNIHIQNDLSHLAVSCIKKPSSENCTLYANRSGRPTPPETTKWLSNVVYY